MNAMTDTTGSRRGVSVPILLTAIGVTAVLSGAAAWLLFRPSPLAPVTADAHENEPPPGQVELTPEAERNAALGLVKVEARRLPTTIDVT